MLPEYTFACLLADFLFYRLQELGFAQPLSSLGYMALLEKAVLAFCRFSLMLLSTRLDGPCPYFCDLVEAPNLNVLAWTLVQV